MAPEHETFFSLLSDASHWEFEGFIQIVLMVLIGFWRLFLIQVVHIISDDKKIEVLGTRFSEVPRASASSQPIVLTTQKIEVHGARDYYSEVSREHASELVKRGKVEGRPSLGLEVCPIPTS